MAEALTSFPPVWHSGASSVVSVSSKSISYFSWAHYLISQDPLQLRYHVTEFCSMDHVGGGDMNDFQD